MACCPAISEALDRAGAGWPDVAGIGLAAQTETFVVWDAGTGKPVFPAISWRDTRAGDACAELRAAGHEAQVRSRTGLPLEPAFSAPKLRWLLDELPGARRAAAGGRLLFGDVGCWLDLAAERRRGARHRRRRWPAGPCCSTSPPAPGTRRCSTCSPSPARCCPPWRRPRAGSRSPMPRCAAGAPRSARSSGTSRRRMFGQRCWTDGLAKLTLGTGAFLWCNAGQARRRRRQPGWCPAAPGRSAMPPPTPSRASCPTPARSPPGCGGSACSARDEWPQIRPGALATWAGAPWCVPALFGLGTPAWTPLATAELGGLTADSTGEDVAEAALIGVVQQIADAVDAVRAGLAGPLDLLRVDGGLSRNESVLQAIADLTGLTLERTAAGGGHRARRRRARRARRWRSGTRRLWPACRSRLTAPYGPRLPRAGRDAARSAWRPLLADVVRRARESGVP